MHSTNQTFSKKSERNVVVVVEEEEEKVPPYNLDGSVHYRRRPRKTTSATNPTATTTTTTTTQQRRQSNNRSTYSRQQTTPRQMNNNNNNNKLTRPISNPSKPKNQKQKQQKRYWKDRLSERLDYALGIHEDGDYYRQWEERMKREEEQRRNEEDNDLLSYVLGPMAGTGLYDRDTTRNRNRRSSSSRSDGDDSGQRNGSRRKRQQPYDFRGRYDMNDNESLSSILDESPTLGSLLFGRSERGSGVLNLRNPFRQEHNGNLNIMTSILQSAFTLSLFMASYLARWASVRGAIPQPLVVFTVTTTAICAPKRKRLLYTALTLIAVRTIGEALHGYIYGNEDFWDNEEMYSHDDYYDDEAQQQQEEDDDEDEQKQQQRGQRRRSQPGDYHRPQQSKQ